MSIGKEDIKKEDISNGKWSEKEGLVLYILEQHTENIKNLTQTIYDFTVSQAQHDESLKTHSDSLNRLNTCLTSYIDEVRIIREQSAKVINIENRVEKIESNNSLALKIYGFILIVIPIMSQVVLKKYWH